MVGRSPWSRCTPRPLVALPCGSRSTSRTLRSCAASEAARLTAVVVLPTPPFWFAIASSSPIGSPTLPRAAVVATVMREYHGGSTRRKPPCLPMDRASDDRSPARVFHVERGAVPPPCSAADASAAARTSAPSGFRARRTGDEDRVRAGPDVRGFRVPHPLRSTQGGGLPGRRHRPQGGRGAEGL